LFEEGKYSIAVEVAASEAQAADDLEKCDKFAANANDNAEE